MRSIRRKNQSLPTATSIIRLLCSLSPTVNCPSKNGSAQNLKINRDFTNYGGKIYTLHIIYFMSFRHFNSPRQRNVYAITERGSKRGVKILDASRRFSIFHPPPPLSFLFLIRARRTAAGHGSIIGG